MAPIWENLNICPLLHWLQLPCHSHAELSSLNGPKFWGEGQKAGHNIAFLLVWVEYAMGDRHYGLSIIWVDPSQVSAASMEEVARKLTACTSSGTNWPYTLVWLHKGTCHVPLPMEGHLGILLREGWRQPPVGRSASLRSANSLSLASKSSTP